jgi:hypothetical integral membrane protein (TIGR02206 family)
VAVGAVICTALCVAARLRPGGWTAHATRTLAVILTVTSLVINIQPLVAGTWRVQFSLPLHLCSMALIVAAIACWRTQWTLAVETTYFWGIAGTLQGILTPALTARFPHLLFFEYTIAHVGVVTAVLFLVVGRRMYPRRGAVLRVFAVTVGYTAFVGVFDWISGANYMYLRRVPGVGSLLSIFGPWPWYIFTAACVAFVMFVVLDAPFRRRRPPLGDTPAGDAPVDQASVNDVSLNTAPLDGGAPNGAVLNDVALNGVALNDVARTRH